MSKVSQLRRRAVTLAAASIALAAASALQPVQAAVALQRGDVFAGVGSSTIKQFSPSGTLKQAAPATVTTLRVKSGPGLIWTKGTRSGLAVLTYGHNGCPYVDINGFCPGRPAGAWTTVKHARWISNQRLVSRENAVRGGYIASFHQDFNIPQGATSISGLISIACDNSCNLFLNESLVGSSNDFAKTTTFAIHSHPGSNALRVGLRNGPAATGVGETPQTNPAGAIWRADIIFDSAGDRLA
jgi:hypothetical protein